MRAPMRRPRRVKALYAHTHGMCTACACVSVSVRACPASEQVCMFAIVQVLKCASAQVCKGPSAQVCKGPSAQVCKGPSAQVCKCPRVSVHVSSEHAYVSKCLREQVLVSASASCMCVWLCVGVRVCIRKHACARYLWKDSINLTRGNLANGDLKAHPASTSLGRWIKDRFTLV
eukprot:12335212-Alexandrium_andersonii.AAC.1